MGNPGERVAWSRVPVGDGSISVGLDEPLAIVRRHGGADVVASWPELDLGLRAPMVSVMATATGAWVTYRPMEAYPEEETVAPGIPAAVHIGFDGRARSFPGVAVDRVAGASRHGLWLRLDERKTDPDDADMWADDDLRLLRPDGSTFDMHVDRRIAWILDAADGTEVAVHTAPPRRQERPSFGFSVRGGDGRTFRTSGSGGWSWKYSTARVPAPEEPLGGIWRTRDQQLGPVDDAAMMAKMSALTPRTVGRSSGDPRAAWVPVTMPFEEREAAVASVLREFASFDGRSEEGTAPSRHGNDADLQVRGEWPDTRVVLTFWHPVFPEGRMRRTVRVFDAAGRFVPPLYASVHLFEDLETRRPAEPGEGVDGFLDI